MVEFQLVKGRKSPNDIMIKTWSYGEVLSFQDLLFLLDHVFKNEDELYPINRGYRGKCYFLEAILEVYSGVPYNDVLKRYQLDKKTKAIVVENLHEVLE